MQLGDKPEDLGCNVLLEYSIARHGDTELTACFGFGRTLPSSWLAKHCGSDGTAGIE